MYLMMNPYTVIPATLVSIVVSALQKKKNMKNRCLKKLSSFANKRVSFIGAAILALPFVVASAHAFEKSFMVKVRDGKRLTTEERTLTDLTSENSFEELILKW